MTPASASGRPVAGEHVALAGVAGARAAAAERADRVAAGVQLLDELGADVAGRAGDKDGAGFAHEPLSYPARDMGIRIGRGAVGCHGTIREEARDQGPGGADRRGRRDHPHVGTAVRLPRARAHGGRLPRLHRAGRRRAAARRRLPQPRALGAGGARAGALARGRDRPAVDLRRARLGRHAGAPAAAAPADADRALAGDRGGGDGARRRPGRDRRLPGRGATTAPSSTATGAWRTSPTPSACSRPSTSRASATRTSRPRSRSRPPTRSATSGR